MDAIAWERLLIGACIKEQTKMPMDVLVSDFSLPLHREIWKVSQELAARGGLAPSTLVEVLRENGSLEALGGDETARGAEYIGAVVDIADPTVLDEYILQVKEASAKRRLTEIGKDLIVDSRNGKPSDEIADKYIRQLFKVEHGGSREARSIGDGMEDLLARMERIRNGEIILPWRPRTQAVYDLFNHADEADFIILVASPGSGKSSYLRHEALETSLEGKSVLTITLENTRAEAREWAISKITGINHRKIKDASKLTADEWKRVKDAREIVESLPWYVEDVAFSELPDIVRLARRMAVTKDLDLIQVDGMYLVEDSAEEDGKYQVISSVAQGLRSLAMELHVPILASTQFSRKVNTHKEPEVGDLLYAGENPARSIWGLVRKELNNQQAAMFRENRDANGQLKPYDNHGAVVERIKILKNTGGETGWTEDFVWRKATNRFETLEAGWDKKYLSTEKTIEPQARTFVSAPKPVKQQKHQKYGTSPST